MRVFDNMSQVVEYIASKYPTSKNRSLASWHVNELMLLVGVYDEDEDLVNGFIVYKDPMKDFKWAIAENIHAELAVDYYREYLVELQEAIFLNTLLEEFDEHEREEVIEEDELPFYEDLE